MIDEGARSGSGSHERRAGRRPALLLPSANEEEDYGGDDSEDDHSAYDSADDCALVARVCPALSDESVRDTNGVLRELVVRCRVEDPVEKVSKLRDLT